MNSLTLTVTLYLQLVITRVATMPLVSSQNAKASPSKEDSFLSKINGSAKLHRYKIYNYNTGMFVQIKPNGKINAKAKENDKYAELLVKSHNFQGQFSIQGNHSKKFICMNNTGRVVLKKNFDAKLCMFIQDFDKEAYHLLSSVNNKDWFLGFKRNGLIKHGHRTKSDHVAAKMVLQPVS